MVRSEQARRIGNCPCVNAIESRKKAAPYRVHDLIQLLEGPRAESWSLSTRGFDDAELLILDEWVIFHYTRKVPAPFRYCVQMLMSAHSHKDQY